MSKCKKRPDGDTFHFYNVNKYGLAAGDCAIRAISGFLGKKWEEVYSDLFKRGLRTGYMINDTENFVGYLKEQGYYKQRQPRRNDRTKYTAREFCQEIAQPGHYYVLSLANHLTFVGPDCRIWDTWDCGYKTVGNYWIR